MFHPSGKSGIPEYKLLSHMAKNIEMQGAADFDWEALQLDGYTQIERSELSDVYEKTLTSINEKEVIKGTTVKDIDWVRPTKKEDKIKKEEYKTWEFKSKSSDSIYKVTQKGINNFICTCPGVWRSKDRSCIHIKEVKNEKNN
jgi:hypothetical protein